MVQAEYARARAVLKEALALAERRQDPTALAEANTYLGHATVVAGDVEEGTRRLQEAVRRWEALGNPHGLGETLFYLGYAADVSGGAAAAAAAHYTAALGQLAKAGNAQHAGSSTATSGCSSGSAGSCPARWRTSRRRCVLA
jgi:hypothetical protein